ncbi:UDP-N-acetylmuramoyl-L-alanyl-D-glutamate--2,6-diaminopimelate ligase [Bariatricus massiliensis]|uniref:UDP-N-acetylmuramyl-tripeptide synthetase n=1 Tax=Bariatricus massiliensis TaxID=1745713 RepID=A0ABS8DE15_9FIRM|nr:UDP-N-acetylmuramoyl-L-alanyl-D-glutamate--2,6-diaminopimelate ligase [Bariatricus massiliensis]MCB7302776.1 UDP-N-acetylmuramoyl-L-alanyl-D-glutamate--2,6-diaminopimelate ligase [Bariatricus massiliensis]MCB7373992.1 UDP-N-acetylmuramoyl-L-alanyl-D-glutamate--2,6-diaminopimelate ligase [Bariatricus massiliensis]MCB7386662.1 UDP-N-acetylmuramoyl-L-alanyl-D-glutamate--2,6-diaminopimelate ligase [Bariatricus massiliensis]MCB7410824.1 UDP-N-acetylmuramoyl-L-alanyl-D-glutamate--2,6-diaminopimela
MEQKKYTLGEYALLLENVRMMKEFYSDGQDDIVIDYLTYDSKQVTKNTLFICKGAAFKAEYLDEAVEKGAVAYVSEQKFDTKKDVPYLLVDDIRKAMPPLAEKFHNAPWKDLTIIGIGGTKGKSTSAYYMKAIVDDYMKATGGKESAVISSIDIYDGVITKESHITTPEAVELQEHFRHAVDSGITFAEMEVSSQALKYNRVDNMRLDVGIFLNISEDHISPIEHKDFEDYFASKLRIFASSDNAVVNLDADYAERILEAAKCSKKVLTFSIKDETADVYGYDIQKDGHETVFTVRTKDFDEEFRLTMPGLFNVENALAVIAASILVGIPLAYMKSGLYRARSSGRMELYASKDKKIIAVVDYAHNKLSFEKLFSSTRDEYPDYEIVSIFGCPGKKAFIRRRDLGTVAGQYSKKVYLTAEDPGYEPVEDISKDIAQYVEAQNCPYTMIEDRGEAIKAAIEEAEGKTILLITGKGNETRQKYGCEYLDCKSDVQYVKELLAEYDARC